MRFYVQIVILLSLLALSSVLCGHEVLHNTEVDPSIDVLPHELAIVQFDTRPLGGYWNVSAHHNFAYALRHRHQYLYLTMQQGEACMYKGMRLSPVWCKVKAMLKAHRYLPTAKGKYIYIMVW